MAGNISQLLSQPLSKKLPFTVTANVQNSLFPVNFAKQRSDFMKTIIFNDFMSLHKTRTKDCLATEFLFSPSGAVITYSPPICDKSLLLYLLIDMMISLKNRLISTKMPAPPITAHRFKTISHRHQCLKKRGDYVQSPF